MNDAIRRLSLTAYVVAFFFIMFPIVDTIASGFPYSVSNETWRYGFAGIASNQLVSIVFGLLVASLAASATGSVLMLRVCAILCTVFGIVFLIMEAGLALDTLQLHSSVRPEDQVMFKIGSLKTAFKIGGGVVMLAVMDAGCLKLAKAFAHALRDRVPEVAQQ